MTDGRTILVFTVQKNGLKDGKREWDTVDAYCQRVRSGGEEVCRTLRITHVVKEEKSEVGNADKMGNRSRIRRKTIKSLS